MKQLFAVLGIIVLLAGCAGHDIKFFDPTVEKVVYSDGTKNYEVAQEFIDGDHTYKLLTMYDVNAVIPTVSYPILFRCNKEGKECQPLNITPIQQPGIVTGLAAPVIHGMAIVGAGYLIGKGLERSGSTVNQSNSGGNASASGGNATSSSSSSSNAVQSQSQSQFHHSK